MYEEYSQTINIDGKDVIYDLLSREVIFKSLDNRKKYISYLVIEEIEKKIIFTGEEVILFMADEKIVDSIVRKTLREIFEI